MPEFILAVLLQLFSNWDTSKWSMDAGKVPGSLWACLTYTIYEVLKSLLMVTPQKDIHLWAVSAHGQAREQHPLFADAHCVPWKPKYC